MSAETDELNDVLDMTYWMQREGVEFRQHGAELNIKECPSCANRKWKVYVNEETGLGHCHVCGEGFNKFKFIKAQTGLSWGKMLSHVKEVVKEQGWRPKKLEAVEVEYKTVKMPPSFELPTAEGQNLLYLDQRGITGEIARYFKLRCCDMGYFENRVIIPVFDLNGDCVSFQARDVTGKAEQKYLFPKGSAATGRYLYNGQNAGKASHVCMGEGAFDVFAIKLALDENPMLRDVVAIGSFGKYLSRSDAESLDQLGAFVTLRRGALRKVTIMWDGEEKALVAALDTAAVLKKIGLTVRIALLPAGKDPNEVPPAIVRDAFINAKTYTPFLDVQMRLKNPYVCREQSVSFDFITAV